MFCWALGRGPEKARYYGVLTTPLDPPSGLGLHTWYSLPHAARVPGAPHARSLSVRGHIQARAAVVLSGPAPRGSLKAKATSSSSLTLFAPVSCLFRGPCRGQAWRAHWATAVGWSFLSSPRGSPSQVSRALHIASGRIVMCFGAYWARDPGREYAPGSWRWSGRTYKLRYAQEARLRALTEDPKRCVCTRLRRLLLGSNGVTYEVYSPCRNFLVPARFGNVRPPLTPRPLPYSCSASSILGLPRSQEPKHTPDSMGN
jgi:hypothetical protein